jgi:hypothetical protein
LLDEITLYVPNIPGQLNRALKALAEGHVNLLALSLEQAGAYGIVRLIAHDTEKAEEQLKKYAFGLTRTKVFAMEMPHKPGALQDVSEALAASEINIEYAYVAMPQKTTEAVILLKVKEEKEADAKRVFSSLGKDFHDLDEIR